MKKSNILLIGAFTLSLLGGCAPLQSVESSPTSSVSQYKHPEFYYYYDLGTCWWVEIYCWQIESGEWRCGCLPVPNFQHVREMDIRHFQLCDPCELSVMREIIEDWDERTVAKIGIYDVPFPFEGAADGKEFVEKYGYTSNIDYLYEALGLIRPDDK